MFKQGPASDLNNYRPISVISVIAKVFERIVYDKLYNVLNNEDIISPHQSGFRSLHSTVTTGNPGSVIVPQYGTSKITVFVRGKNIMLKFLGNTK